MINQKLQNELNLCYTQRWVIAPMMRQQSVAEHCYRVQVLVRMLAEECPTLIGSLDRAILYALDHDHQESLSGDTPGPLKDLTSPWQSPGQMLSWEIAVKIADSMEAYDWWTKWGVPSNWVHPYRPVDGKENRDLRKIRWYCNGWPELLLAVERVMVQYLGFHRTQTEEWLEICRPKTEK